MPRRGGAVVVQRLQERADARRRREQGADRVEHQREPELVDAIQGDRRGAAAARILPTVSSTPMTALPLMCPHFFGITWSSRWIPETPACSCSATVRRTLIALPYPVSASAITGTSTAETMRRALSIISVAEASPTSGRPSRDAVLPKPGAEPPFGHGA